jgi:agmatinase
MSESARLPMNFGGIDDEQYSSFDTAEILILPVSYGAGDGAAAIIDVSRKLELYEEETDSELYKLGIHTLEEFKPRSTPEAMTNDLHIYAKDLLKSEKFICMIGGEHSVSAPVIKAHAEKFHNMSVLQIGAHAHLGGTFDSTLNSHAPSMAMVVKDLRIPSVQLGIRSISADEARSLSEGLPTKIFWARDIAGKTNWIDSAIDSLTDNVFLTIDIDGLDPSIVPTTGAPEPGGLGWYETLALIRKLAEKKRIIGMDLVEYSYFENYDSPAFLCSKLVYKSLAYIFKDRSPKVMSAI